MKKLYYTAAFAGVVMFSSCTDHEIIPPPLPMVDLNCDCDITVDGVAYTYMDSCYYFSEKSIISGGISNARYRTLIKEEDLPGGFEMEIRAINWADDGSNNPTLAEWKSYFLDNPTPGYSANIGHNGIAIRWTDPEGNIWINDTNTDVCLREFVFNSLIQESDTTGDYMQFDATLKCKLVNPDLGTKCIENGHVRSAFQLK